MNKNPMPIETPECNNHFIKDIVQGRGEHSINCSVLSMLYFARDLEIQRNKLIKHSEKLVQLLEGPLRIGGCDRPPNGWCEDAQKALREHEALKSN